VHTLLKRLAPIHAGLLVVLSGPAGAMMCTTAASQSLEKTETKKQRDISSRLPLSHVRPETHVQLPRPRYLLETRMLVIFSAFKTGLDASGRTSCELKRAGACLSTASDFLLRLNAHDPTLAGIGSESKRKNGR
jgi:hypothetical protein